MINKYDKLLEQYQNDEEGLENALWEEGIEKEDVEKARKTISQSETSPELAKLVSLQEQLSEHKENGVLLSSELSRLLMPALNNGNLNLTPLVKSSRKNHWRRLKKHLDNNEFI